MDKNEVLKILNDWNFWKRDLETGIRRDFYIWRNWKNFFLPNQVLVITGARRSGKSFIMRQLVKSLIDKKGEKKSNIPNKKI